jgi:uncharacterized protein
MAEIGGKLVHILRPNRKTTIQTGHSTRVDEQLTAGIPAFQPARWLKCGHRQTVFGSLFPGTPRIRGTITRHVRLADEDIIVLHDDRPEQWQRGDHVVVLLHGLAGCHQSGYMTRCATKLNQRAVRTFRMDHRGCGAGGRLARLPYHAGRIEDLDTVMRSVEKLCPGSLISLVGFSLSGNLVLRYLGDSPDTLPMSLFRAVAVCPPVDLQRCTQYLNATTAGQRYDRYFTRKLISQVASSPMWRDDLPIASVRRTPQRLLEFDDLFTAPASGFDSAEQYYAEASAHPFINNIRVHTTILAAADDPVVDAEPLCTAALPLNVNLCVTQHGGHLGFVGQAGTDPDRRWMDWRVVDWLLE